MNIDDETEDSTIAKTIWSETVIELLCIALKKNKPDDQIKELVKECQQKGFKKDYLIDKVSKEIDMQYSSRLKQLMN